MTQRRETGFAIAPVAVGGGLDVEGVANDGDVRSKFESSTRNSARVTGSGQVAAPPAMPQASRQSSLRVRSQILTISLSLWRVDRPQRVGQPVALQSIVVGPQSPISTEGLGD
jgi:hypothetical protein